MNRCWARVATLMLSLVCFSIQAAPWDEADERRLELLQALDLAQRHGFETGEIRQHLLRVRTDTEAAQVRQRLTEWFALGQIDPSLDLLWLYPARSVPANASFELESLLPTHPDYLALVDQLEHERTRGPEPEKVRLAHLLARGADSAAVPGVRERLIWLGYPAFEPPGASVQRYDAALERAVRAFQADMGLRQDGIVGPQTLKRLNLSAQERIDQIRIALERWRWLPRDLGDRYLLVRIPGYELHEYGPNDQLRALYASISGQPLRPTGSLSSSIEQLVVNPLWFVPEQIMLQDLAPKISADPGYLNREHYRVERYRDGQWREVEPESVNWSDLERSAPSVRLVQSPGPWNALGRIRFHMPNPYAIYLHDTPHPELFDQPMRALSSGCIRVQGVEALAASLIGDKISYLNEALSETETRWIELPKPIPVHLVYLRAWVDRTGRLQLRDDIYDLDQPLLDELRSESLYIK